MKKTGAKSGKRLKTAVILLIVLLGGAGLAAILLFRNSTVDFSADLQGYETSVFAPLGNGFAALSEVSARLYGPHGETIQSLPRSYPDGMIASSKNAAAVWPVGGTAVSILYTNGKSRDLNYADGITTVDLNDEGYAVILAGEKGYKGFADVIRPDGSEAYRLYVASGYPIDVDISPDSRHIAILSLTSDGTRLSVYSTSEEEPEFEWEDSELYFDVEYLRGGRIFLISAEKAVIFTSSGMMAGEYAFKGDRLRDYSTSGTAGVVLVIGQYQTGSGEKIITMNNDAVEIAVLECDEEISVLSAAGSHIAILGSDDIKLYDWGLNERLSLGSVAGVQTVMMRTDGRAILISGGGAVIIEP